MSNDEKDDKLPSIPGGKNAFEDLAAQGGKWLGPLLKFKKGDYVFGPNDEEFSEKELVALMPGLMHGYILWEDNTAVQEEMGLPAEGYVLPERNTLGHLDKTQWENPKRDPWQESFYLPVITVNAEAVYTFATSSDGGRRHAIRPLCGEYGMRIREHPDDLPVFGLEQNGYEHSDPSVGWVKYPLFPVKRYVKAAPYLAAVAALTGRTLKLLPGSKAA
jgi:hypothetical protein